MVDHLDCNRARRSIFSSCEKLGSITWGVFPRKLPGATGFGRGKSASRWGCGRYNEITGTYLSDKLPDHAVPAARDVRVFRAVFSVLHDPQLVWKFVRKYFTRRAKHHFFRGTFSIIDSARGRGFVTSFRYLSRWGWLRQILPIIKVILLLELWILVGVKWESLALIIKNYLKTGVQYSNKNCSSFLLYHYFSVPY